MNSRPQPSLPHRPLRVRTREVLQKVGGNTLYVMDHASIGVPPPAVP
jgi:hypothetical protein